MNLGILAKLKTLLIEMKDFFQQNMFSQKSGSCHSARPKSDEKSIEGGKGGRFVCGEGEADNRNMFGYAKNGIHKNERKSNNEKLIWFSNPFFYTINA